MRVPSAQEAQLKFNVATAIYPRHERNHFADTPIGNPAVLSLAAHSTGSPILRLRATICSEPRVSMHIVMVAFLSCMGGESMNSWHREDGRFLGNTSAKYSLQGRTFKRYEI